jgi:hypothetical protein
MSVPLSFGLGRALVGKWEEELGSAFDDLEVSRAEKQHCVNIEGDSSSSRRNVDLSEK